jgi:acyl-coenzyme A thioesterase PaaI-like protein
MSDAALAMTREQLAEFLATEFPQTQVTLEAVGEGVVRVRQRIGFEHLRPGGTVSGPTLVAVADVALYLALLAVKGPIALAVTTGLTVNFLRKPPGNADILGDCRLLKVGGRLVVGEVLLYSDGFAEPVAQVTGTYSLPPGGVPI